MKRILLITIIFLLILPLLAKIMVIEKSNGGIISVDTNELINISFNSQRPYTIEIEPSQQTITWVSDSPDLQTIVLTITAQDATGNPLANTPLVLDGEIGYPTDYDYTAVTNENGEVNVEWIFFEDECPPSTPAGPGILVGTVSVSFEDEQVSDEVIITLYQGA